MCGIGAMGHDGASRNRFVVSHRPIVKRYGLVLPTYKNTVFGNLMQVSEQSRKPDSIYTAISLYTATCQVVLFSRPTTLPQSLCCMAEL